MKFLLDLLFRVVQLFTEPYFLVFLGLIIIAVLKRKSRYKKLRAGIGISIVLLIIFIGNGFLGQLTSGYLQKSYLNTGAGKNKNSQHPFIVVLGGGVVDFDRTEKLHIMSYSRLVKTYQLYYTYRENHQSCKILVSGKGRGRTSEAELFSESLKKMGYQTLILLRKTKA